MATTGGANPFVVNLTELQNVITSAGGTAPSLSNAVAQLQQMVLYDTKEIRANILNSFDTGSISVNSPLGPTTTIGGALIISAAGSPGIGKYLTCTDTIGTAEWQPPAAPSDRALKANIRPIGDAWAVLEGLHGVRFEWHNGGRTDVGVIAQDVEKVLPEAFVRPSSGPAMVEYHKIIPVLIETVKGLERRVSELERR